jgi:hypothetical protein
MSKKETDDPIEAGEENALRHMFLTLETLILLAPLAPELQREAAF